MATFKFFYFPVKALGEVSRIFFNIAGQPFEDVHIEFADWSKHKASFPFQQVPVLEITENGKTVQISQSNAIERYL